LKLRIPYKTAAQAREIIDGFGLLASKIDSELNSLADARGSDLVGFWNQLAEIAQLQNR
jgi:hypothetical protein